MKTFKTEIEKPKLVIEYDTDTESPRGWDNLGYFYTKDSRMKSPDGNTGAIYDIMIETGDHALDQADHIEQMTKLINKETDEKVLAIYPVTKYEHSGVVYKIGSYKGFDYSNNGFYIITDKTQKLIGTKKDFWKIQIDAEMAEYNQWANGEVYRFELYDENGDLEDSCGGFYDIEAIKEYLPEEWEKEDLTKYLI